MGEISELPTLWWNLLLVLLFVAINAFFVAAEFALVSVRRSRVDELISQGVRSARAVRRAITQLDRYIAGTQIGITIASLALGWIGEPVIAAPLLVLFAAAGLHASPAAVHALAYGISFGLITFFHVVFGELVPKSIALQSPERMALAVGRPMSFAVFVFQPLITLLNGTGNFFLRIIGFRPAGEFHGVHSVEELGILVSQSYRAGVLDELEREILERTFHFSELSAGEIKTPRTDIDALDLKKPPEELLEDLSLTAHTRLPVFEESIDQIVGIIHVHDVYRALLKEKSITDFRALIRPALLVPEGIHLDSLVEQFREQHTKIAIVVDEYGATAGLVTFKDLVEEVFGNVQSAPGPAEEPIQRLPDGRTILARADLRLDELNREIGWELEDEDVDTIAGLVMKKLGRVAQLNDVISCPGGTIRVVEMEKLRIVKVLLALNPEPQEPSEENRG